MCGHGIIAIAKVALETGLLPMAEPETTVHIDTPAGLVTAYAQVAGGHVTGVRFHNVPSFVLALDETVEVPGLGPVRYDLAFGAGSMPTCPRPTWAWAWRRPISGPSSKRAWPSSGGCGQPRHSPSF